MSAEATAPDMTGSISSSGSAAGAGATVTLATNAVAKSANVAAAPPPAAGATLTSSASATDRLKVAPRWQASLIAHGLPADRAPAAAANLRTLHRELVDRPL